MNLATITAIQPELKAALIGKQFGKIFCLSRSRFAIDLRLSGSQYLFIAIEPAEPRTYLIVRRLRDLEKGSVSPTSFAVFTQKRLGGAAVTDVTQVENERVLLIRLAAIDEIEGKREFSLAVQLTGRSANLFLLDAEGRILDTARESSGDGQRPGDIYAPPVRTLAGNSDRAEQFEYPLSPVLDDRYLEIERRSRLAGMVSAARKKLSVERKKLERLKHKLEADAAGHGDADHWKRLGDLALANASSAERDGDAFVVTDYYDPDLPKIRIETRDGVTITQAAEDFFKRYAKARNGADEIAKRLKDVEAAIAGAARRLNELESAAAADDEDVLRSIIGDREKIGDKEAKRRPEQTAASGFARTFTSSDGFEILVGKKAKDNDFLTFRHARSLDLWMHAADYPGSHVVVRNPTRGEIPPATLHEAAKLAAFYSQGKAQTKAAVHYTPKKFVNKPRGAAPGLVSLASFKTILVVPGVPDSVKLADG